MQSEQELLAELKEMNPHYPSKEFKSSTEEMLRMKARGLEKKRKMTRLTMIVSGGFLMSFLIFSLLILYTEKDGLSKNIDLFGQSTQVMSKPVIYIYHTHNRESFFPELPEQKTETSAVSETKNVMLVGDRLSNALRDKQINSIHDTTDIIGVLEKNDKHYPEAYTFSGYYLKKALEENESIQMVFDIHRDSSNRNESTIEINGQQYARIQFIVSKISVNYQQNKQFALQLHKQLEKQYPGLSLGVVEKGDNPQMENTYNQELHENSLLLNIGGIENSLEEAYRTADIFADIIKDTLVESK